MPKEYDNTYDYQSGIHLVDLFGLFLYYVGVLVHKGD
jgi:hypothetical protein